MLKVLSALFVSVLMAGTAQARSLHPCTPMVEAKPTYMTCPAGSKTVSIRINTRMSNPYPMCSGENHQEAQTAYVLVRNKSGKVLSKLQLFDGEFDYAADPYGGNGTFESPKYRIRLKGCVSPINGGVSFGN